MRQLNRIPPQGRPELYQTFAIRSPLTEATRRAECSEVDCAAYREGWVMQLEKLTPAMVHAVKNSGRKYTTVKVAPNNTLLTFPAGQNCFRQGQPDHRVSKERPEFFFVGRGDYRLFNPKRATQFKNADDWVDNMAAHLDRQKRIIERG